MSQGWPVEPTGRKEDGGKRSGAARWLEQSTFVASSLETGRVGYLEAWGGDEFGYAYSYAFVGQPGGVSVDADTGILSIAKPLKVGRYVFGAIVTNRGAAAKRARFPVALEIRRGARAGQSSGQILHKVYDVDSGLYGMPAGRDYTHVLLNIRRAISQDQVAAGDGNLRATVRFRRGRLYDYTDNTWPVGVQYLTVEPHPGDDVGKGRPQLRNVKGHFVYDGEIAILFSGSGTAFDLLQGDIKIYSPRILAAEAGSDKVRLRDPADAARIAPGRWHLVGSYDQQVGGYPPNIRYFDYVQVVQVAGDVVVLDRRLRHSHRDDLFELPSEPASIGAARLIPMDLGGADGLLPANDARLTIRQTFRDIEFVKNPSTSNGSNEVVYINSALDASFENCVIPRAVPSVVEHVRYVGGRIGSSEPDKLIATLICDGVTSGEIGGATGVDLYFMRNSTSAPMQVSPRQLRIVDSTIDATNNRHFWYPLTWAYNGPILSVELQGATIRRDSQIAPGDDRRIAPSLTPSFVTIGTDAAWQGTRLVIPRDSPKFLDWEVWLFEGMILCAETGPADWGIVRRIHSPGDGSAIWAKIEWMAGTKPTSGKVGVSKGHSLRIDSRSKIVGTLAWVPGDGRWGSGDGGFMRQQVPFAAGRSTHGFPAGYPASEYGF
jgi:hypothetical protein